MRLSHWRRWGERPPASRLVSSLAPPIERRAQSALPNLPGMVADDLSSAVRRDIFVASMLKCASSVGAAYSAPDGAKSKSTVANYKDSAPDGAGLPRPNSEGVWRQTSCLTWKAASCRPEIRQPFVVFPTIAPNCWSSNRKMARCWRLDQRSRWASSWKTTQAVTP